VFIEEIEPNPMLYAKTYDLDARRACRRNSLAENSLKEGLDRVDDSIGQILDDVQ
jgi:hypothetical protein